MRASRSSLPTDILYIGSESGHSMPHSHARISRVVTPIRHTQRRVDQTGGWSLSGCFQFDMVIAVHGWKPSAKRVPQVFVQHLHPSLQPPGLFHSPRGNNILNWK